MNEVSIETVDVTVVVEGNETVVVVDETTVTVELGTSGPQGGKGTPGVVGRDPYTLAVDAGFVGTEAEWLASLVGAPGKDSTVPGPSGPSAYDLAVTAGFVGTEPEWRASLTGAKGPAGPVGRVDGILATVAGPVIPGQLTKLIFDGEPDTTLEGYRRLSSYPDPSEGDRVVLVNTGGELTIYARIVLDYQRETPGTVETVTPMWPAHQPGRYGDITISKTAQTDWVLADGVVVIPATNNDTPLFRLPMGSRPQRTSWGYASISLSNPAGNMRALRVDTDGFVWGYGPATQWPQGGVVTLSDLRFNISATTIKAIIAGGGPFGYGRDAHGLIYGIGTWVSSSSTSSVASVPLATADRTATAQTAHTGYVNTNGVVGVNTTVTAAAAASFRTAGGSLSLTALLDPIRLQASGGTLIWNTPALLNGWSVAGGEPVRYALRPDGLVIIQGRIEGGLEGAPAFYLPEGFRPSFEQVHTTALTSFASGGWTCTAGGSVIPLTGSVVPFGNALHLATH